VIRSADQYVAVENIVERRIFLEQTWDPLRGSIWRCGNYIGEENFPAANL
jgi:hypothetical protein